MTVALISSPSLLYTHPEGGQLLIYLHCRESGVCQGGSNTACHFVSPASWPQCYTASTKHCCNSQCGGLISKICYLRWRPISVKTPRPLAVFWRRNRRWVRYFQIVGRRKLSCLGHVCRKLYYQERLNMLKSQRMTIQVVVRHISLRFKCFQKHLQYCVVLFGFPTYRCNRRH